MLAWSKPRAKDIIGSYLDSGVFLRKSWEMSECNGLSTLSTHYAKTLTEM